MSVIDLTLTSLCNIVSRIILISYMSMHLLWIDTSFGQINVQVNSRMLACFIGCVKCMQRGVPHIQSFFEFGHGKGEHDGAGACVKRALVKEQLKISAAELLDACSIVDWCSLALSQWGNFYSVVCRFFWLVEEGSIGDRSDCATVRDSSKMHSFRSSDSSTWTIWTRQLACFCPSCFQCDWDHCESSEWVDT